MRKNRTSGARKDINRNCMVIEKALKKESKKMNIVGALIFIIVGVVILFASVKLYKREEQDYKKYPVSTGTLLDTESFLGERWFIEFTDQDGYEVIGMDDRNAASTFHPDKYHTPRRGNREKIYYWKYTGDSHFSLNGQSVDYNFHFVDETLYDLANLKEKNSKIRSRIIGTLIVFGGIAIFLFG